MLQADGMTVPLKYVIDDEGWPVLVVPGQARSSVDTVLCIPDEREGALELVGALEDLDAESAIADRWRIYHGDPRNGAFVRFRVEAGKMGRYVYDGSALCQHDPLRSDEPAICREINQQQRERLTALCRKFAEITPTDPLLVGVDAGGFDIRSNFVVIRVPAPRPMTTSEEARSTLAAMFDAAEASS